MMSVDAHEKWPENEHFVGRSVREENQEKSRILKNTRRKTVSAPAKLNAQNPVRINARSHDEPSSSISFWFLGLFICNDPFNSSNINTKIVGDYLLTESLTLQSLAYHFIAFCV